MADHTETRTRAKTPKTLHGIMRASGIERDIMQRFQIFASLCDEACTDEVIHGAVTLFVPQDRGIHALLQATGLEEEEARRTYRHHLQPHAYIVQGTIAKPPYETTCNFTTLAGTSIELSGTRANGVRIITDPLHTLCKNSDSNNNNSDGSGDDNVTTYTLARTFVSYV